MAAIKYGNLYPIYSTRGLPHWHDHRHGIDRKVDRTGEQLRLSTEVVMHQDGIDSDGRSHRPYRYSINIVVRKQLSSSSQDAFMGIGTSGGSPVFWVGGQRAKASSVSVLSQLETTILARNLSRR